MKNNSKEKSAKEILINRLQRGNYTLEYGVTVFVSDLLKDSFFNAVTLEELQSVYDNDGFDILIEMEVIKKLELGMIVSGEHIELAENYAAVKKGEEQKSSIDIADETFYTTRGMSILFFDVLNTSNDGKMLIHLFRIILRHLTQEEDNSNFLFPYIKMNADILSVKPVDLKNKLVQMLSDNDEYEMAEWINSQKLKD